LRIRPKYRRKRFYYWKETDTGCVGSDRDRETAAFGFPVIQKIDANNRNTQALILSPTRERYQQIKTTRNTKKVLMLLIYGGASITDQAREIKRRTNCGDSGRMQDMINRGLVNISQIDFCILDEADEMLNMGFYEDIVNILSTTPDEKIHGYSRLQCLQK
jgi:ATP-dependent RNA helicase DeaD